MHLTRRYFLKSSGAFLAYSGVAPLSLLSAMGKSPQPVKRQKSLVVVFLRGGLDGLNFIVPHGDPAYAALRKSIAIPAPSAARTSAVDLDGFFGLHPSAAALAPLLSRGDATALHAVGYDHNTRSHFEEQDTWETGIIGNTIHSDGWLNRHLATSTGHGPIRALSIGDTLPRILAGKVNAFAVRGLNDLSVPNGAANNASMLHAALEDAYCTNMPRHGDISAAEDLLAQSADTTLEAMRHLNQVAAQKYQPAANYAANPFAEKMKTAARLLKANIGLEVVEIDYGGWDTHNRQGGLTGNFANKTTVLAEGLAAFFQDLGDRMNDVLVLTLSDFGRTAKVNGSGGTDHGWANCMLAMGGGIPDVRKHAQSPVLCNWPGLAPEQLNQGRDLLHTTDFRDVIAEVVQFHLGNPHLKTVLPGHEFSKVGLVV